MIREAAYLLNKMRLWLASNLIKLILSQLTVIQTTDHFTQIILFLHYSPFYILVYDDPTAEDGLFIFFLT